MYKQDGGIPGNTDTLVPPVEPEHRYPQWWLAVRAAVIAYALTLGAALVTMALLVLGFFLGGAGALNGMTASASSMGASIDGPSALLIYPFFLAAMALGGAMVLTVSSAGYAGAAPLVSVWAGALPLLLTGVAVLSLWHQGRRAERRAALESDGLRWLYSGVTGLALAACSVALSLLFSLRSETDAGAVFLTAGSPGLVAGAVLLGTAASWAGRRKESGTAPQWILRTERALPGFRAALRLAGRHYLVYTAAAGAVILVTALIRGGVAVAFASPLWLPTASAWAYAAGHLSTVTNRGLPLAGQLPASVAALPVWAGASAGVLGLLLAAAASLAWFLTRNRDSSPGLPARRASWLTLPVAFGLTGAAVSVLSLVAAGRGVTGGDGPGAGIATLGPAWWTFLVMAAWGAVIELGARILAPHVAHLVPQEISGYLTGNARKPGCSGERGLNPLRPVLPRGALEAGGMSMTEHLNNHHRETLDQILRHPTSSNIEWKKVRSLLEAVADTTREHNGKYEVTIAGQTDYLEPPRDKDIDEQTVVDLRKMLTRAGYTLDTK